MNRRATTILAFLIVLASSLSAHRLDEYLEATIISIEPTRIQASMRLVPGVAVSSAVVSAIDSNADNDISSIEAHAYAQRVLQNLSISIDGERLSPLITSVAIPTIDQIREGIGEIDIEFMAAVPVGGVNRKLIFENHHEGRMAAYLANCLVPRDKNIQITSQTRNRDQSFYQINFKQAQSAFVPRSFNQWWSGIRSSVTNSVGGSNLFRLGMHHIAEGTDHLLFLLALLLPAPLLAAQGRWALNAGLRHSLVQILKVVSAFTIGHSLTLALSALGLVSLPVRPTEVLIAVSILISAIHALRPLFPGREAIVACFFGLIHGLAFASVIAHLGLGLWQRLSSILAFNLGIEAMQLSVVVLAMPSLILLSRTPAYRFFRVIGATFAGVAALGWILERLFKVHTPVDLVINGLANHALFIAALLFAASLVLWACRDVSFHPQQALRQWSGYKITDTSAALRSGGPQ